MPDFSLDRCTITEISSVLLRTAMDFPATLTFTAMPFERLFWVEEGAIYCHGPSFPEQFCSSVMFIPRNVSCRIQAEGSCHVYSVSFSFLEQPNLKVRCYPDTDTSTFPALFEEMQQLRRQQKSGWRLQLFSDFYRILHAVQLSKTAKAETASPLFEEASAYLRLHFADHTLSVEQLAAQFGISRQYLRTLFTEHYGVSPLQYLHTLRLEYARELLLTTMLPVEKIALQCGFRDIFTFSKAFKGKVGQTPSAFRRSYRSTSEV